MYHVTEAAAATANFIPANVLTFNFLLHFSENKLKEKYCRGYLLPLFLSREFLHLLVWTVTCIMSFMHSVKLQSSTKPWTLCQQSCTLYTGHVLKQYVANDKKINVCFHNIYLIMKQTQVFKKGRYTYRFHSDGVWKEVYSNRTAAWKHLVSCVAARTKSLDV
jgi:hypothetical protein